MEYDKWVPKSIPKKGDFFWFYCGKCKSEEPHHVKFQSFVTSRNQVRFSVVCYLCYIQDKKFNEMNKILSVGEDHYQTACEYIYPVSLWNEWILNSRVSDEDLEKL